MPELNFKQYKVNERKYDIRFNYYHATDGEKVYYNRETKLWWKLFELLGNNLDKIICRLHHKFGKKRELTKKDYKLAREYASSRVSEEEYLRRFASINPYSQNGWSNILWWIRHNLIYS